MIRSRIARCVALALLFIAPDALAQVRVSPTSVSVSSQGATTAFLTFSGLRGAAGNYDPAEGAWCGAIVAATPDRGLKCDPTTMFGVLPSRLNQSRLAATGVLTDIMSIPASVSRRAYLAVAGAGSPVFYFVRRFINASGGQDLYVPVTCRLSNGGVGVPFALTSVRLAFTVETPVLYVQAGVRPPPLSADLRFTGTGRLKGRWEVVLPGEEPPQPRDLLTEATLPPEERGTQRRYRELSRFNVFLPPMGRFTLNGPDVSRLPTTIEGGYLVLLRIEVGDDRAGAPRAGVPDSGLVFVRAGGVAGFPLPVLRYVVGTGGSELSRARGADVPRQLEPADRSRLALGRAVEFTWSAVAGAASYRLEIVREDGSAVLNAVVQGAVGCGLCGELGGVARYRTPPWLAERAGRTPLRWRVVVIDATGRARGSSGWRRLQQKGDAP